MNQKGQILSILGNVVEVEFYDGNLFLGEILVLEDDPEIKLEVVSATKKEIFLCLSLTKSENLYRGARAYSKRALLSLNLQGRFTYTQETFIDLSFKGLNITEIPIKVRYFPSRRSKVASNLFIYGINTLKIILGTYRDYRPLAFFSVISLIFLIIGISFESVLLWTYFSRGTFSPNIWSGFVGAAFFFLSVIFFIVGLSSDILNRIRLNQESILYLLKKNSHDNS